MDLNQSSYSSELSKEEIVSSKQRKSGKNINIPYSEGVWSQEEKLRYVSFLVFNKNTLSSKLQRRTSKVFKQMAGFIETRTPAQCRSQNQKTYKRFKTITRIVTEFKRQFGESKFQKGYARLSQYPNIKFLTELDIKGFSKEESHPSEKSLVEVGIQTEEVPMPYDLIQHLWMKNMLNTFNFAKNFENMSYSFSQCIPTFPY